MGNILKDIGKFIIKTKSKYDISTYVTITDVKDNIACVANYNYILTCKVDDIPDGQYNAKGELLSNSDMVDFPNRQALTNIKNYELLSEIPAQIESESFLNYLLACKDFKEICINVNGISSIVPIRCFTDTIPPITVRLDLYLGFTEKSILSLNGGNENRRLFYVKELITLFKIIPKGKMVNLYLIKKEKTRGLVISYDDIKIYLLDKTIHYYI